MAGVSKIETEKFLENAYSRNLKYEWIACSKAIAIKKEFKTKRVLINVVSAFLLQVIQSTKIHFQLHQTIQIRNAFRLRDNSLHLHPRKAIYL